jgi:hypothetical protein
MDKKTFQQKRRDTFLRMCGNIASGQVGRYSSEDLAKDEKRRKRIAENSVDIASKILKEAGEKNYE